MVTKRILKKKDDYPANGLGKKLDHQKIFDLPKYPKQRKHLSKKQLRKVFTKRILDEKLGKTSHYHGVGYT